MNKSKFLIVLIFFSCLNSVSGGDRWQSYVNNDWHKFKSTLNLNTLFYSGAWLSGMYVLSYFDEDLNNSVKSLYSGNFKLYFKVADQLGYAPLAIPVAAGIAGLTLTGSNQKLQDAAFTSLQASLVSALITGIGKFVIGRGRPYEKKGPHFFYPFRGLDESFPSGHSSTAFALITPWVYYYPGPLTYILLALPTGTALARMIFDKHWATDILTGSLIGILVGYNLARWHKQLASKNNYYSTDNSHNKMALSLTFSL